MPVILWGVLALTAGALFVGLTLWLAASRRPPLPPDVDFPPTRLQRAALVTLVLGGLLAAAAFGLVFVNGPAQVYDTDGLRLAFTFLVLGSLVVFAAMLARVHLWSRQEDGSVDERDLQILNGAHAAQGPAILVTLAIWTVGLTESFRDAGGVPTYFLFFVFWSVLVIHLSALPLAVLLSYRRR